MLHTCKPFTVSCILSLFRSRKLSIKSPSMKPSQASVFLSVWKDRQLHTRQGTEYNTSWPKSTSAPNLSVPLFLLITINQQSSIFCPSISFYHYKPTIVDFLLKRIQWMFNFADTLDNFCQTGLDVLQERVKLLWYLCYQTCNTKRSPCVLAYSMIQH